MCWSASALEPAVAGGVFSGDAGGWAAAGSFAFGDGCAAADSGVVAEAPAAAPVDGAAALFADGAGVGLGVAATPPAARSNSRRCVRNSISFVFTPGSRLPVFVPVVPTAPAVPAAGVAGDSSDVWDPRSAVRFASTFA